MSGEDCNEDDAVLGANLGARASATHLAGSVAKQAPRTSGTNLVAPPTLGSSLAPAHPRHVCDAIESLAVLARALVCSKAGMRVLLYAVEREPSSRHALRRGALGSLVGCLQWSHSAFSLLSGQVVKLPSHPVYQTSTDASLLQDSGQKAIAASWQLNPDSDSDDNDDNALPASAQLGRPPPWQSGLNELGSVLERRQKRRLLRSLESARCVRELCTQCIGALSSHDHGQTSRALTALGGLGWRVAGPLSASALDRTSTESANVAAILCNLGLAGAGGIAAASGQNSVPPGQGTTAVKLMSWTSAL